MNHVPCIGLVDDDAAFMRALRRLLRAEGYTVNTWSSAEELLAASHDGALDCLVLDMHLPGLNGLELQDRLAARGFDIPVIFLTGKGDIPTTVRAMRGGAVNFLTKPVTDEDLFAAVRSALEIAARQRACQEQVADVKKRHGTLTPREREVMTHLITGKLNKQIAADLGTSEQTIKVHRMRLLEKFGVRSIAELVRLAALLRIEPAAPG
jgi:FixJ family two-component response regulator